LSHALESGTGALHACGSHASASEPQAVREADHNRECGALTATAAQNPSSKAAQVIGINSLSDIQQTGE
jgi:hypothetical protein